MAISELQMALIGAGGVAIAAVWGYNAWQDRQHRKVAERLFKGEQSDVLLKDVAPVESPESPLAASDSEFAPSIAVGGAREFSTHPAQRLEPTLGSRDDSPETASDAADADLPQSREAAIEGVSAAVSTATEMAVEPMPPISSPTSLPAPAEATQPLRVIDTDVSPADQLADCVVRFRLPESVPASSIWAAQGAWRSGITKPLMWLGCNPGDAIWHEVTDAAVGRYSEWVVALQLADRRGALSDAEINVFCTGLEQMGGRLGSPITLPDPSAILQRAQSLDAFCASVDVQFGISVVEAAGGSFAGTKLRGVCEAAGLTLGTDGSFHSLNDNGAEEFRISNIGSERFVAESLKSLATHGVTLTIDVPRVADGAAAFNRLITTAQQLARGLGGVVVDIQRAPLADAMVVGIRAKIVELQQHMRAADIPPGSTRALRLFA